MRALDAASGEACETKLRMPLKLTLRGVVVDRDLRVLVEPGDVLEVPEVVERHLADRVRRRKRAGGHPFEPLSEALKDPPASFSERDEVFTGQPESVRFLLDLVPGLEKARSLDGKARLGALGVAERTARLGVAVGEGGAGRTRRVAPLGIVEQDPLEAVEPQPKAVGVFREVVRKTVNSSRV
jgi:hypothetical protein